MPFGNFDRVAFLERGWIGASALAAAVLLLACVCP